MTVGSGSGSSHFVSLARVGVSLALSLGLASFSASVALLSHVSFFELSLVVSSSSSEKFSTGE